MECVEIPVLRVNAVGGKTAAETVGTVVHGGDGFDDVFAVFTLAIFVKNPGDGAAGRDPNLTFFQKHIFFLLMKSQRQLISKSGTGCRSRARDASAMEPASSRVP